MKTFKAITTAGSLEFVDWYACNNESEAMAAWKSDCFREGLPDTATVVFVECDPVTLKPICVS